MSGLRTPQAGERYMYNRILMLPLIPRIWTYIAREAEHLLKIFKYLNIDPLTVLLFKIVVCRMCYI